MINKRPAQHLDRYLLIAILVIASWLRFHYLLQIEHNLDHAYPVWQALNTLYKGEFPLIGQLSGTLFSHPPLTGYLYIPIIALTQSLTAIYVLVITFNMIGVYLTYRAGYILLGSKVGLIAAALLAVNPWVIEYSRYSWPPALLPFFLPLVLWLFAPLWQGTAQYPRRRTILAFLALGLMCQTTLLAYLILPTVGLLTLIFIRRMPWKALLGGIILFLVIQTPFFIGLMQRWSQVESRVSTFAEESSEAYFRDDALRHAFRLVSGEDYELARGVDAPQADSMQRHAVTRWFAAGLSVLLVGGILISLVALFNPKQSAHPPDISIDHARSSTVVLWVWFFLPILLMSYNATFVHPYYQLLSLPAGMLFVGWAVVYLIKPYTPVRMLIVGAFFIPFAILMGINSARFYQETQAIPGTHDLGALPLDWGMALGAKIREHLPENGVVFADVDEWTLNSLALKSFPLIRDNRAPTFTIVPKVGGLYIVAHPPDSNYGYVPAYAERVDTLALPDGWVITIDQYQPDIAQSLQFDMPKIRGEKWLSLMNYWIHVEDQQVIVTSLWQVENLTPEIVNYTFAPFIHVYDDHGERVQIVDGMSIAGTQFHVGDLHVHQMSFPLDGNLSDYRLELGQFDGLANLNLILITEDGEYVPTITLDAQ